MSAYCIQGPILRALYSRLFVLSSNLGTSPVSLTIWVCAGANQHRKVIDLHLQLSPLGQPQLSSMASYCK